MSLVHKTTATSFRRSLLGALLTTAAMSLVAAFPSATFAATFSVNNTDDSGPGSLRQAILDANANPGPDDIDFDFWGRARQRIVVSSPLPIITETLAIDGEGQIELSPSEVFAGGSGLELDSAPGSSIRGLTIEGFSPAIVVAFSAGAVVEGNLLRDNSQAEILFGLGTGGILVAASSGTQVKDNVVLDTEGDGILGLFTGGITVEDNHVENSTGSGMVKLFGWPDTIKGNTFKGNGKAGLEFDGAPEATIKENTFSRNAEVGLVMGFAGVGSSNVDIVENVLSRNGEAGIAVYQLSYSTIKENRSTKSDFGFAFLDSSNYNLISENDACGNEVFDAIQSDSVGNDFVENSFCSTDGIP